MYDTLLSIASHLRWTYKHIYTHNFTGIGKVFDVLKSVWFCPSICPLLSIASFVRCARQPFCSLIAFWCAPLAYECVFNFLWSLGINHKSRQTKENKDALKVILINKQIWYNVCMCVRLSSVICSNHFPLFRFAKCYCFSSFRRFSLFDSDFTVGIFWFSIPYSDLMQFWFSSDHCLHSYYFATLRLDCDAKKKYQASNNYSYATVTIRQNNGEICHFCQVHMDLDLALISNVFCHKIAKIFDLCEFFFPPYNTYKCKLHRYKC